MAGKEKCSIDSLPIDVLMKILLLLSVDELTQLKGVCKLWFTLITSRHFSRSHCSPQRNQSVFEFVSVAGGRRVRYSERLLGLSLGFSCNEEAMEASVNYLRLEDCFDDTTIKEYLNPNHKIQFNVLGSCDGLLLVKVDNSFMECKPRLLIFNPFTKSCRLVTKELPWIGHYEWTIAYDSSAGRYKVLGGEIMKDHNYTCSIFDPEFKSGSIRTDSMKQLSIPLPRGYWITCQSVSTNGKIHLLAMESELPPLKGFLVSIDVSKEEWKVSPIFSLPCAGIITGANGTFHHTKCSKAREFKHWVLVDFDSPRWVVQPRVSVNECPWFVNGRPRRLSCPVVIGQDRTRLFMQYQWGTEVFVYHMTSLRWNAFRLGDEHKRPLFVHNIKSLVSLK